MDAFLPSDGYAGSKPGYVFKTDVKGTGYYLEAGIVQKRKRDETHEQSDAGDVGVDDNEDAVDVPDMSTMQALLVSFEKRITLNLQQRSKFMNEPEKFMNSEIDLSVDIGRLSAAAANPELLSMIIQADSIKSILGCVTHDNIDISIQTIKLLLEITEPTSLLEIEENGDLFLSSFLKDHGLELIVHNLSRLDDEGNADYEQCFHNTLGIIENLIELNDTVALAVTERTHILKYLLERLTKKPYSDNKLYCSEILSILLQSDSIIPIKLCNIPDMNGMDTLLQAIAVYKKAEVESIDEKEIIENLFLSLQTILLEKENQAKFVTCEGFELMIRILKEAKYAAICSIKSINYALIDNPAACAKLIDVGGLKYIFPILSGKGLPKGEKKSHQLSIEEDIISIMSQLAQHLYGNQTNDCATRLLLKFIENDYEKFKKCVDYYTKYRSKLAITELHIQETIEMLSGDSSKQEEYESFVTVENIYLTRLEGGLYVMQQLVVILIYVLIYSSSTDTLVAYIDSKLSEDGANCSEILEIIREMIDNMDVNEDNAAKKTLITWSAGLATILMERK
jgi:beta-catenin-like protein 1